MKGEKGRQVPDYKELMGLAIGQILEKVASEVPEKEALVYKDQRVTYREFLTKSQQVALALKRSGIQQGDRIAIWLPNGLEFAYAQFGILHIGAVFIPMSTRYRLFEMNYMLKHSGAKGIFIMDSYLKTDFIKILEEVKPDLPDLKLVVVVGKNIPSYAVGWEQFMNSGKGADISILKQDPLEPKELASILYTSGSTGMPKGVMTTHQAYIWWMSRVNEKLYIGPDDSFIHMLPSSHMFGFLIQMDAMMGRCKNVIMETFEPEEALRLQDKEKVSILYGVPTMFNLMLSHPNFKKYDLSHNRTGYMSGSDCPIELVRAVMKDMHCNISNAYGMSEVGCMTISDYTDDEVSKATTSGQPLPGIDLKIVDDNRREVPRGVVGEIAVRSGGLLSGYYKQPELTKESFDSEGFFYTGDLGKLDEKGRLIFVGRKKEMLIRGGFNVYPIEVEEQIRLLPEVESVAILGIKDEKLGEKILACIVPKPGKDVNPEAVIAHCKRRLANYKVPDVVELMSELPMTSTGKIQKFKLKEELEKRYQVITAG